MIGEDENVFKKIGEKGMKIGKREVEKMVKEIERDQVDKG